MPAKNTGKQTNKKTVSKISQPQNGNVGQAQQKLSDGFEILKSQNKDVRQLAQKVAQEFRQGQAAEGNGGGQGGSTGSLKSRAGSDANESGRLKDLRTLCRHWLGHHHLNEEVVWPHLEDAGVDRAVLRRVELEHDLALVVLADMIARDGGSVLSAEAAAFCEMVPRIAKLEETQLFPKAKKSGVDSQELGKALNEHSDEMSGKDEYDIAYVPQPLHLQTEGFGSKEEYKAIPVRGQNRDRDEYGRFTDDDDDRGRSRGGYARTNGSFGLTTLRTTHIRASGTELRFQFKGKSGKLWNLQIKDRRIARAVRSLQELPGQNLFQYVDDDGKPHVVTSAEVNAYLREIARGEVTAKYFRTWGGTVLAALALHAAGPFESQTEAKRKLNAAIRAVAERLGNTPKICRDCYVHPVIVASYLSGTLPTVTSGEMSASGLPPEERVVLRVLRSARAAAARVAARSARSGPRRTGRLRTPRNAAANRVPSAA